MAPNLVAAAFVAVAVAAGGLAAGLGFAAGDDAEPALELQIGVSRIGDEVSYERQHGTSPSSRVWRTDYRVVGESVAMDARGDAVTALKLEFDAYDPGTDSGDASWTNTAVHVGLASRAIQRYDLGFDVATATPQGVHRWTDVQSGYGVFSDSLAGPMAVELQGLHLREGFVEAVSYAPVPPYPVYGSGGGAGGGSMGLATRPLFHDWMWTQGSKDIDADGPIQVRFDARLNGTRTHEGERFFEVVAETGREGSDAVLRSTMLYDGLSAYPALLTTQLVLDGGAEVAFLHSDRLVAFSEGSGPAVDWSAAGRAPVPLEFTSQFFPADGEGRPLSFPLSKAIATVNGFPPLEAWKLLHQDHHLVAAAYRNGRSSTETLPAGAWQLVYATPAGQGHAVSVERSSGSAVSAIQDHGDITVHPYDAQMLPRDALSLSSVHRAWEALTEDPDAEPNYVRWGLNVDWQPGLPCILHMAGEGDHDPAAELATVQFGSFSGGSCVEPGTRLWLDAIAARIDHGVVVSSYVVVHDT